MKLNNSFIKAATTLSQKIITVSAEKGGVGKTTITLNLAKAIALAGKKVLVVDCDPQGDLTALLNNLNYISESDAQKRDLITTVSLFDDDLKSKKVTNVADNIDIIIGTNALVGIEQQQTGNFVLNLKKHLRQLIDDYQYDVVVIDTPPSAGNRMLAAQIAADLIVIPTEISVLAIRAIPKITERCNKILDKINAKNPQVIVIPNKIDKRMSDYKEAYPLLKKAPFLISDLITYNATVKRTANSGKCVWEQDSSHSTRTACAQLSAAFKQSLNLINSK